MEKRLVGRSNSQLKKCSRGKRCRLPEDRLSSLSDDILLFIQSFLTFKEVVKMSLLSHRWMNLWKHSLVIHYHAPISKVAAISTDRERRHNVKWINRILRRLKGHYLKEFKIVCNLDKSHQKEIDKWLVFALAKKVRCLELNLSRNGYGQQSNLHENYVFPGRFQLDLKCLESLSLEGVDVTSEAINFILLSCPFLERLEVVGSMNLVNLVISDPTLVLKYLKIKDCSELNVLSISEFNLISLDISSVEDLYLKDLPMLVELLIEGASSKLAPSTLSCFLQLEALTLTEHELEDLTQLFKYGQYPKLKRLVIGTCYYEILTAVISIIEHCPHLEEFVLTIDVERPSYPLDRFGARRPRIIWFRPKLPRMRNFENKSLKVFEFVGYYGRSCDDELIMHIVANAICLEKIIIDSLSSDRTGYMTKLEKEEARSIALEGYKRIKESIPPHVHLLIRQ